MLSSIGKSMQSLGSTIQTAEVDDLAITTDKLANNAVTSAKIAALDDTLTFDAGVDIAFRTTGGTKIGTGTDQLIGFYNATPVDQPETVTDGSDAATTQAAVNAVIDRLQELGLIAT